MTCDPVNHPAHYTQHPSGVECIQITRHFNFNIGNAIKYLWRAGLKGAKIEDLQKAAWYINDEIVRLSPPPEPQVFDAIPAILAGQRLGANKKEFPISSQNFINTDPLEDPPGTHH